MSVEYGYVAEGSINKKSKKQQLDPREKELIERALKNIKLPNTAWKQLREDLLKGVGKKTICQNYGIKSGYFKYIKKALGVN